MSNAVEITASAAAQATGGRTITGRIAVYDVEGNPSSGRTKFAAGSIVPRSPMSKVKLLIGHDQQNPVGYMVDFREDSAGITATFYVPEGPAGDKALAEAANHIRDGLSVGVMVHRHEPLDGDLLTVTAAELYEVSLVAVPGYSDTLVTEVKAMFTPTKEEEMSQENTAPEAVEAVEIENPVAGIRYSQETPEASDPAPTALTAQINAAPAPVASQPTGIQTVTAAADRLIQGHAQGENLAAVTAALTDVIPAHDAGGGALRKTWIGELFQASSVDRPMISLFGSPKPLTGLKVYGWKWDLEKLPKVGKYTSDKKQVPSNALATVPVEGEAQDFAAGWDIARKYFDLGDSAFIESILRMATDDYQRQTDLWFGQQVMAAATNAPDITSVLLALQKLPLKFAAIGAKMSGIQLGEAAYESLLKLSDSQVPWWLKNQGSLDLAQTKGVAASVRFEVNPGLEANQILAVDSRAASYYEHGKVPVKVQAIEVAKGGIDLSVHGYAGAIIHDPRAIIKATITPA